MINITLPDNSIRQYTEGTTAMQIALSISEGLARNVLAAKVNGQVMDATRPLISDAMVQLLTWNDQEGKATMWHSSAHLMAEAVEQLFPGVKFGIGPDIENGFYYDMDFGDRNLYVNEITIDHKITIPYLNNSVYDISGQDEKRRIINNFSSNAELARNRLLSTGIDSSIIISVPANRVYINRTLTSALAVRDWLKKSDIKIVGINIISEGTHARRTWMTYNKVLNETYKIGIISLPEKVNARSHLGRLTYTFRQSVALVYYWLILSLISL